MEQSIFDDIRPIADSEVPEVLHRLCKDPEFRQVASAIPGININEIEQKADSFTSVLDFQLAYEYPMLEKYALKNSQEVTSTGTGNVTSHAELYLTNHRDITIDPAYINLVLFRKFRNTSEIAIGDNLYARPWIRDFVRLSRSFTVRRNLNRGEMMTSFAHLSAYVRYTITEKGNSVWMAQREGRSKDATDLTQESLIKMLSMSGGSSLIENLIPLNIHPTTFSYEFDPCDYLKAIEFQQRRDNPGFRKGPMDDVVSMRTGIQGYHGRINIHFAPSINPELERLSAQNLNRKQQSEAVCRLIDNTIHSNYIIYPINEWAYSQLYGDKTPDSASESYLRGQLAKVDIPNPDMDFIWHKLLEMYANPLKNKLISNQ
ncbi:MAG: 1-acyl-sn-glycerol-3-phosphate acyltransferase [Paludibacteraceae bacterium]|nr:1-acyl-sn-glycerol-3-phosphate acyltransferase [Paludibacteraceae bacterium]